MMIRLSIFLFVLTTFGIGSDGANAQENERYAILIGGLGGSPEYSTRFEQYLFDTRKGLVEQFGFESDHVVVLGETAIRDRPFVDLVATSDNIRASFAELGGKISDGDLVLIVIFGHGSYDGTAASANIPRRDLTDGDFARLLDDLPTPNVVFINTTSASGPFVRTLSFPDRVVITATKSGGQTNETRFPHFLVEGLGGQLADLDRDGNVSFSELFTYAAESTAREYEADDFLATEHALLDDNGDGRGHQYSEQGTSGDGNLAAVLYLNKRTTSGIAGSGDLAADRSNLERQIAEVKSMKDALSADEYYGQLEVLFVQLARLSDRIEGAR
ncbi:MAG: hypothetical protein HKN43_16680 [Rhodothermales bacterium]|nr:hypothetical protein [Rhodothermales bacterium]